MFTSVILKTFRCIAGRARHSVHAVQVNCREVRRARREVPCPFVRIPTLLVALLLLAGCFPLRFTTSPGASGVVVDSQTRAPIAGAEVVVSRSTYPPGSMDEALTNRRPPSITTETNGSFSIPPERAWDLFVIPVDAFPPFGLLVVKHDGYDPVLVPFWSRSTKPLGEVLMKPSANEKASGK